MSRNGNNVAKPEGESSTVQRPSMILGPESESGIELVRRGAGGTRSASAGTRSTLTRQSLAHRVRVQFRVSSFGCPQEWPFSSLFIPFHPFSTCFFHIVFKVNLKLTICSFCRFLCGLCVFVLSFVVCGQSLSLPELCVCSTYSD